MKLRDYQRRFLRAPYHQEVLFVDDDFVFKGRAINISERGLLLDEVGHFPQAEEIGFLASLPQLPQFKNFDLERIRKYNIATLEPKIVRFKGKIVRKAEATSAVDGVFLSKIALDISEITPQDQQKISQYVDVFAGNLIYLLVLIDNLKTDQHNLEKVRRVSEFLGYSTEHKISYLRKLVEQDYSSLQWN